MKIIFHFRIPTNLSKYAVRVILHFRKPMEGHLFYYVGIGFEAITSVVIIVLTSLVLTHYKVCLEELGVHRSEIARTPRTVHSLAVTIYLARMCA